MSETPRRPSERTLIALTIFLGAFLLFAVEPLIAKVILPWFGGSASVWIACLLFFQAALLAGYSYAHLLDHYVPVRLQRMIHLPFLAASLLFLPIIPSERWKPAGVEQPLVRILELLSTTIGLPFVLLATTGPLTQAWLSRDPRNTDRSPVYRLYALSNVGSLLALLAYPVLIEPWLGTQAQTWLWSGAYAVFVVCTAILIWRHSSNDTSVSTPDLEHEKSAAPFSDRLLWFALAAVPSMLLLAVTNQMLRNIAPIPLLWVVPLALYLLSLIICFDHSRWYYRPLWYGLLPFAIGTMILSTVAPFLLAGYALQLAIYGGAFFMCCMVCHGELAQQKPAPRHLTSFYLTLASGGVAGGLLVAVVAPAIFDYDRDLTLALIIFTLLCGFVAWRRWPPTIPSWLRWNTALLVAVTSPVLIILFLVPPLTPGVDVVRAVRNFYGPLQATLRQTKTGPMLELQNGSIVHGREFGAPDKICEPLSYYARTSGIGVALEYLGRGGPLRVGIIGLGAGTLAAYAREGDTYRFYEINPQVQDIATGVFHYLTCGSGAEVKLGDARLTLEQEGPNSFDLLAVDAFNSDAIPVHLLTRQAFDLYWRHIKPGGLLLVHVSNTFVDLAPIVAAAAEQMGRAGGVLYTDPDESKGISRSAWVMVINDGRLFEKPPFLKFRLIDHSSANLWTDDYSNLWRALKW